LRRALPDATLPGFDAVLVGGAATPPALLHSARDEGVRVVTTYGMTETSGGCVYDGVPLPGVDVTTDVDGVISLAGATLALGYRADPVATATAFAGGAFRTADVGTFVDGRLMVHGRVDDVINTGGVKVHPLAVEAVVAAQPGVRDCAVAGVPDAEWGQAVHAWIVGTADDADLRDAVRAACGIAAVPKRIHRVTSIPLLPSGKPDRRALAAHPPSSR
jgi:O-succinylbenzoic acid--CoA ligase